MKWWFLGLRMAIFRFFQGQSIAFMSQKLCFYMLKAALLPCQSYALSGYKGCFEVIFPVFWAVFDVQEAGLLLQMIGYQ